MEMRPVDGLIDCCPLDAHVFVCIICVYEGGVQEAAAAAAAKARAQIAQLHATLESVTVEFREEVVSLEEAGSAQRRSLTHALAAAVSDARQTADAAAAVAAEVCLWGFDARIKSNCPGFDMLHMLGGRMVRS